MKKFLFLLLFLVPTILMGQNLDTLFLKNGIYTNNLVTKEPTGYYIGDEPVLVEKKYVESNFDYVFNWIESKGVNCIKIIYSHNYSDYDKNKIKRNVEDEFNRKYINKDFYIISDFDNNLKDKELMIVTDSNNKGNIVDKEFFGSGSFTKIIFSDEFKHFEDIEDKKQEIIINYNFSINDYKKEKILSKHLIKKYNNEYLENIEKYVIGKLMEYGYNNIKFEYDENLKTDGKEFGNIVIKYKDYEHSLIKHKFDFN